VEGKEIVGIRFKPAGEIFYVSNPGVDITVGERCVVRLEKGKDLATIVQVLPATSKVDISDEFKFLRISRGEDDLQLKRNCEREREAFDICGSKITKLNLPMKLIRVKYTFDGSRITFYFKAPNKVDFRQLVRELAQVFRTRIELRQIGSREEAELLGGVGICGRVICCHGVNACLKKWIIQSSREGSLDSGVAKVSGVCGRLLCCLKYEQAVVSTGHLYVPPAQGSSVTLGEEAGRIARIDFLKRKVFVSTSGIFWTELSFTEAKELVKIAAPVEGEAGEDCRCKGKPAKDAADEGTRNPELEKALREAAASAPIEEEPAIDDDDSDDEEVAPGQESEPASPNKPGVDTPRA
jgi:cell fate regulator YaaT (PSP1 superfamily)